MHNDKLLCNMYLIHTLTGNIGEFIKEYRPMGMSLTTQIRLKDGRIYYAPSSEFVKIDKTQL